MANWGWILKARAVLGKLTDWLNWGRSRGYWQEKDGPGKGGGIHQ